VVLPVIATLEVSGLGEVGGRGERGQGRKRGWEEMGAYGSRAKGWVGSGKKVEGDGEREARGPARGRDGEGRVKDRANVYPGD
jgi:hypothetical protein